MRSIRVALSLAALISPAASGLDISYVAKTRSDGTGQPEQILMKGEIVPGDLERFVDFIRKDPERFLRQTHITITSPGGDVVEAMELAALVNYTRLSVRVTADVGPCISACFFIYVSAADRLSSGKLIGIHRPYIDPIRVRNLSPSEAQEAQEYALRAARKFLQDAFVPANLIDTSFQRASTQIYWLTTEDLLDIGLQARWYEEYLIAQCDYQKGTEEAYLRVKRGTQQAKLLLRHLRAVHACGRSQTAGERRQLVEGLLSRGDDAGIDELDEPYVQKVLGLRELIKAKQVASEAVGAQVVADQDAKSSRWSFAPGDVQKLEAGQTWWLDTVDDSQWAHFTVYVRNSTERHVSSILFELTDAGCEKTPRQRLLLALPLQLPLRPFEDRALRFSSALPQEHTLLGEDAAAVCGSIVGAR
jgi:hypothetical protein